MFECSKASKTTPTPMAAGTTQGASAEASNSTVNNSNGRVISWKKSTRCMRSPLVASRRSELWCTRWNFHSSGTRWSA